MAEIFIAFLCNPPRFRLERLCGSGAYTVGGEQPFLARREPLRSAASRNSGRICAMDIAMLGIVIVFFGLCFAYAKACDRL